MIQSSTSPWCTTMFGTEECGSKSAGLAFHGEVERGGTVGILGIFELFGKIKSPCANRLHISQPGSLPSGGTIAFAAAAGRVERGAGASAAATIFAIGRVGSFSPPVPCSRRG